ncbi:MAG: nitrogen fixation protein FixH [Alphaproteobacteria bacterium]|nr:MAG: nitrogen fixation protein FixH [Alphaproteobacteria bacterium]
MAQEPRATGRPITGWTVLAIFVGAFSVIIGVNIFMAWSAIGTFPGLEVENSYVASQTFDKERAAQEALGWTVAPAFIGNDKVVLEVHDRDGVPVRLTEITAMLGRTTERNQDQQLTFEEVRPGRYVAAIEPVDFGKWELRYVLKDERDVPFRQRVQLVIEEQ